MNESKKEEKRFIGPYGPILPLTPLPRFGQPEPFGPIGPFGPTGSFGPTGPFGPSLLDDPSVYDPPIDVLDADGRDDGTLAKFRRTWTDGTVYEVDDGDGRTYDLVLKAARDDIRKGGKALIVIKMREAKSPKTK